MQILIHFSFEPDNDPDDSSSGSSEMEVDQKAPVKVDNTVDDTVDDTVNDAVAVDENNNSTTQCKWGSTCFYFQCIYIYI